MREKSTQYKILYSEPALKDIENVTEYLVQYSSKTAEKFIDHFDKKINFLKSFPEIGPLSQIPTLHEKGYRILILKYKYLLFYTVNEKDRSIMIERILYGARDLRKILLLQ